MFSFICILIIRNKLVLSGQFSIYIPPENNSGKPSNEAPAFTKSTNMVIWVVGTTNKLFIKSS